MARIACEAMAPSFSIRGKRMRPCSFQASVVVDGKNFCKCHASQYANRGKKEVRGFKEWRAYALDLESRLATAESELAAEREARERDMKSILRMDQPFSLFSLLERSADAISHLLRGHNCDCTGHEILQQVEKECRKAIDDLANLAHQQRPVAGGEE